MKIAQKYMAKGSIIETSRRPTCTPLAQRRPFARYSPPNMSIEYYMKGVHRSKS